MILASLVLSATCSIAWSNTVSCSIADVPIRTAIEILWSSGAPSGVQYSVADSVSRETLVTLSLKNAPFEAAVENFCKATGLKYEVKNNTYYFSPNNERIGVITIKRLGSGEKASVDIQDADPVLVLTRVLEAFDKRSDVDVTSDPSDSLREVAERYSLQLNEIGKLAPAEQEVKLRDLKEDASRFTNPPKFVAPGTRKSISLQHSQISFSDLMNRLGEAVGFMWFREPNGKIIVKSTASTSQVREIFQRAGIWDTLKK